VGSKRIKKGFFVRDGLGKTKNLFLLAYCWKKQVPMWRENHWSVGERWTGWVQIRQPFGRSCFI